MLDLATTRAITSRELDSIRLVAGGLEPASWQAPTRCGTWTVRQLCAHAGLAATRQAEAFRRAVRGVLDSPQWPGAPELAEAEVLALLDDGAAALATALDALDAATLDGMTPMPFGIVPTRAALQLAVYEFAFHGDDLRAATGHPEPFPPDVAAAFCGFLPVLAVRLAARAERGTPTHAYRLVAPAGTTTLAFADGSWAPTDVETSPSLCTISGDDDAIALFAMGRIGIDDGRLRADDPDAAAEFKRWFPGP
jgi:uncharacterized protein (TIGR03083 family)